MESNLTAKMAASMDATATEGFDASDYGMSPEDIAYYADKRKKRRIHITCQTLVYLVLIIWAILAIFPFVWVFYNSFKSSANVRLHSIDLMFNTWSGANYTKAFSSNINVWLAYWNSIYTSVLCVFLCITVSVCMAFALSRYKFPGSRALEVFVIACMMFPAFSLMSPLYRMYDSLKLTNTHFAYILPQIALNMSFTTTLLIGFFRSLPLEIEESAFLDGASVPRTLLQIVLPMMRSALVTCVIFIFLWTYNDLFIQNLVLKTADKRMLPSLIYIVTSKEGGTNYGMMCAIATLIAMPMLVIYLFLQKHIIKGLTAGAVKG